jgi:hypothetical protein
MQNNLKTNKMEFRWVLKFVRYIHEKTTKISSPLPRSITKCDKYPHKTASQMRILLVTEYLVKELKYRVMVVAN